MKNSHRVAATSATVVVYLRTLVLTMMAADLKKKGLTKKAV